LLEKFIFHNSETCSKNFDDRSGSSIASLINCAYFLFVRSIQSAIYICQIFWVYTEEFCSASSQFFGWYPIFGMLQPHLRTIHALTTGAMRFRRSPIQSEIYSMLTVPLLFSFS
jgi:hypothetical protein